MSKYYEEFRFPPTVCPYCKFGRKLSQSHLEKCPAMRVDDPSCHEIAPGLWVGSVVARTDPRFVAVVSILSEFDVKYVGAKVAQPSVPVFYVEHADHTEGFVEKCLQAWDFVDRHLPRGDVLLHCLMGASRSPTAAAGWLVSRGVMRAKRALHHLASQRPPALHITDKFIDEIGDLDLAVHRRREVSAFVNGPAGLDGMVVMPDQPLPAEWRTGDVLAVQVAPEMPSVIAYQVVQPSPEVIFGVLPLEARAGLAAHLRAYVERGCGTIEEQSPTLPRRAPSQLRGRA